MKKWRSVFFVGLTFLLVFTVASACTSWDRPKYEIKGNTIAEKLESLAEVVTAKNDNVLFVEFLGYNAKNDTWQFALFIPQHTMNEVLLPPARSGSGGELQVSGEPIIAKYLSALEMIFVETSHLLPQKKGRIEVVSIFSDLKGFVNSTEQITLVQSDPENWERYMNSVDEVVVLPASLLRDLLQETIQAERQKSK